MDDTSQRILRATCRKLFNMIDYRNFTLYLTKKEDWPQIVSRLSSYNKPIGLKFTKNIMNRLSDMSEHLLKLTNLTSLEFDYLDEDAFQNENEVIEWFKLSALTNLQAVSFNERYVCHAFLQPLVLNLPNMTRFVKYRRNILGEGQPSFIFEHTNCELLTQNLHRWTNLQYCRIEEISMDINFDLFNGCYSKLTGLSIAFSFVEVTRLEKWFNMMPNVIDLNVGFYEPNRYSKETFLSLKSLTALQRLTVPNYDFPDLVPNVSVHQFNNAHLTYLSITKFNERISGIELHQLVNLKHLEIDLLPDQKNYEHTYCWLTAMTALKYLNIKPITSHALDLVTGRLTSLKMTVDDRTLDLCHLSKFNALRRFSVNGTRRAITTIDLSPITILTQLNSLKIGLKEQRISNDFLLHFKNLTHLSLFVKAAEIDHLPNLERADLYGIDEVSGLMDLPNLTYLQIYRHYNYHLLSNLSSLRSIEVRSSDEIDCEIFATLTDLESLSFVEAKTGDYDKLSALTNLKVLAVGNTPVSDALLKLPTSLQSLRLNYTTTASKKNPTLEKSIIARLPNLCYYTFDSEPFIP